MYQGGQYTLPRHCGHVLCPRTCIRFLDVSRTVISNNYRLSEHAGHRRTRGALPNRVSLVAYSNVSYRMPPDYDVTCTKNISCDPWSFFVK